MAFANEVTLEQLLIAREKRAKRQKALLDQYDLPLISFMVNAPGPQKNTPLTRHIFNEGYTVLIKELNESGYFPVYNERLDLATGMEGYIVVNVDEKILKEHTIRIETQHPLGRLFDIDVIGRDGLHISREVMGYPKRECLLCDKEAHVCGRSRAHSTQELLNKIQYMVKRSLMSS
jgi:holo-ACP synthase